jgi:hypothetical protein
MKKFGIQARSIIKFLIIYDSIHIIELTPLITLSITIIIITLIITIILITHIITIMLTTLITLIIAAFLSVMRIFPNLVSSLIRI